MSEDALKVGKQDTSAITGSLRLGISGQLSCERLSSRIARYLQDYPQVDVNVQVIAEPEELLFRLRHNDIDLALTLDLLRTDPRSERSAGSPSCFCRKGASAGRTNRLIRRRTFSLSAHLHRSF